MVKVIIGIFGFEEGTKRILDFFKNNGFSLINLNDDSFDINKLCSSNVKHVLYNFESADAIKKYHERKDFFMIGVEDLNGKLEPSEIFDLCDFIVRYTSSDENFKSKLRMLYSEIRRRYTKRFRPDWDDYFLKMVLLVAERSTCIRHHVGAIAVKDRQILSTGYNGAPRNTRDCIELGCLRDQLGVLSAHNQEVCRAVHAEQNVIIQAANHGVNLDGATLYCTHSPCILCAKMIVNANFKRVVVIHTYPDKNTLELFKEAGIDFQIKKMPDTEIRFML